jgi:hypothetical protein
MELRMTSSAGAVEVVIRTSKRSRLLRFLHRAEEGLRAHYEKGVDAGADQKEREVLDAVGPKAGTDGAGEKIKSGQFGEHSDQGHDETAAVADGREQIAPQDGVGACREWKS